MIRRTIGRISYASTPRHRSDQEGLEIETARRNDPANDGRGIRSKPADHLQLPSASMAGRTKAKPLEIRKPRTTVSTVSFGEQSVGDVWVRGPLLREE